MTKTLEFSKNEKSLEGIRIKLVDLKLVKDVPQDIIDFARSNASIQLHFLIVDSNIKEIIGCINLDKFKEMRNTYNISYMVLEKYRDHNYTKEGMITLLENIYGVIKSNIISPKSKKNLCPKTLLIVTSIHNKASKKIALDLGFIFKKRIKIDGKAHNMYYYERDFYKNYFLNYSLQKFDFLELNIGNK